MEVDLPQLPQRVGLDEMALVVDVESVVDRLTLHVGDETCNVDHCHAIRTLPSTIVDTAKNAADRWAPTRPSRCWRCSPSICDRTRDAVSANRDWAESGVRPGQYNVDVEVDRVVRRPVARTPASTCCRRRPGSSTQRRAGRRAGIVVVDPLDGSTNATLGLPWFATSLCSWSTASPAVSMVTNLATGESVRGDRRSGSERRSRAPSSVRPPLDAIDDAIVAVSGLPVASLRLAAVPGDGRVGARHLCGRARRLRRVRRPEPGRARGVGLRGCPARRQEAGGVIVDALGRDLLVLDHDARRTPVAASSPELLDALLAHRSAG